jgi:DNA polymerase
MKKEILWLDSETYSETPIKDGTWKYAESAEVEIVTYAFGGGEVLLWDVLSGEQMPADLKAALDDPEQEIGIHNSGFDTTVFRFALGIVIPPERVLDTMVQALSHGLPGGLDALCDILGVPTDKAKHKTGRALMMLFCKPQPFKHSVGKTFGTPAQRKAEIERLKAAWPGRATHLTHPTQWAAYCEYAKADITAMREVYKRLPKWNYPNPNNGERKLWELDQRINQRGVAIDVPFAQAAVRAADRAKAALAVRCREATNEEVQAATQRDAVLEHILTEYGISLDDMRKATVEKLLESDIPDDLRYLLHIRLQSSSTAVAKYSTLIKGVSSDGRLRGTIQFCGAGRTKRECLAENTQVKVRTRFGVVMSKRIQDVRLTDEVWDGDRWVAHEGVVFSGDKAVITHDGVVATAEHNVYISTSESVSLGEAKRKDLKLWRGNGTDIFDIQADIA